MLISNVIQSCDIKAIGYEAKSTPEFSSCRITFRGNVSCKKLSFSYGEFSQMYVTEPDFVHSFFRFVKSVSFSGFVFVFASVS